MFYSSKKINKKIAGLLTLLVLFSSFSPIFARKAEAFIFTDWVNFAVNAVTSIGINSLWVKEYALDSVAYTVTNLIIEKMAASTVNWINTGFKGSPAFVTNPESYFKNIGDQIAGDYIFNNPNLNFLCGPISARIKIALTANYNQERQWQCTLTDVGRNLGDFMNQFENGGWNSFFEVTQRTQNNPIGAYLQAENQLNLQIATVQDTKEKQLNWGSGFLSYEECTTVTSTSISEVPGSNESSSLGSIDTHCSITTPGSVIENKLNSVLGISDNRLAAADEINEIVSALLNQLTLKIVGGIGSGLRSLSGSGPSDSQSFTGQLTNSSKNEQIDKYFQQSNQSVDNVLNLPPYDATACRDNPNLPECLPPAGDPNNTGSTIIPDETSGSTGGSVIPHTQR